MDTAMKDMLGQPLTVGDRVVTMIQAYKTTRMQVGTVKSMAADKGHLVVAYEYQSRWGSGAAKSLEVGRYDDEVVKVAA